ncbi:MAG: hypothetical protein J6O50_08575 [Ruminiclostridium sp.]|nr:hypothetical protein [Ruminiclostridium sp.]
MNKEDYTKIIENLDIHDSDILSLDINLNEKTVNFTIELYEGKIYNIKFIGVICFDYMGLDLFKNGITCTIIDFYCVNENYIVTGIKSILNKRLNEDIQNSGSKNGYKNTRYNIDDCIVAEILLRNGDKITIIFKEILINT